ncbi:terminase small subunit [Globicatella sulfidifaciens]
MKLTLKQQRFADEYIISGNATEAAIKAGYARRSAQQIGAENLLKPVIKSYIDSRLKELEDEAIAKQGEVLKYLTSLMRGEEKEQTLIGLGDGEQGITNIEVSAKDRIKAAELLGKRYGIWTDKVDVSGIVTSVNIIDDIPFGSEDDGG